jgi:hypothetical protein
MKGKLFSIKGIEGLFNDKTAWSKKNSNNLFGVTIGSFDWAET